MFDEERLQRIRRWLAEKPVGRPRSRPYQLILQPLDWSRMPEVRVTRNHLPRWQLAGSTYFITFKVTHGLGPILLHGRARDILEEILFYDYGDRYDLDAYVVMTDHCHMLFRPRPGEDLGELLGLIKGRSSRFINLELQRTGRLWLPGSFDRIVRSPRDWLGRAHYIHQNPVRAGLVSQAEAYPWSSLVTIHSPGRYESFPGVLPWEH